MSDTSKRDISRRTFLETSVAATMLAGCAPALYEPPSYLKLDEEIDASRRDTVGPRLIAEPLATRANELLVRLGEQGWFNVIGWPKLFPDPKPPTDYMDASLYRAIYEAEWSASCEQVRRPSRFVNGAGQLPAGFEYFAGLRAIHPGRPEFSALYHALAQCKVDVGKGPFPYPSLDDLDTLESIIFALAPPTDPPRDCHYAFAVLAYEYRDAALTPHRAYDDLVFSRTGIARIGQAPLHYVRRLRKFTNEPAAPESSRHFAATPARYALFLVELVPYKQATFGGYDERNSDPDRWWVRPIRKVYSGDPLIGGASIVFGEQHRAESLGKLSEFHCGDPEKRFEFRSASALKSRVALPLEMDRPPIRSAGCHVPNGS